MQGVLNQARQYVWIPVAQDAYRRISLRVYCHIMDLDLNFHLHKKTGEVTKMVSEEQMAELMVFIMSSSCCVIQSASLLPSAQVKVNTLHFLNAR